MKTQHEINFHEDAMETNGCNEYQEKCQLLLSSAQKAEVQKYKKNL